MGFMLGGALLITMTGCVGYVDGPRGGVYVAPAVVEVSPVFIEQDDYVYYPRYQMYYGSRSRSYFYMEGRRWVGHPEPRGVSVNVLLSAPSVSVGFHDRPDAHHSEVVRSYPKNWKPPVGNPGRGQGPKDNRKDKR